MKINEGDMMVKKFEIEINKKIILTMLIVTSIGVIISGCLAYIFSDSLFTIFCSLVIGLTISILANYIILISNKIITNIDLEVCYKEDTDSEFQTIMKIE